VPSSLTVEDYIRKRAVKLNRFYGKITGCRILVESPHRHHHKGKLYHIRIDLTVPGGELLIKREPSHHSSHQDIYVAIRDAFNAARRKLQDYARVQRGNVKVHLSEPYARVTKLFPAEDFGFLETTEGREIYFHKNSVLEPGFDRMKVGDEVHFTEEQGAKGPQASTVRLTRKGQRKSFSRTNVTIHG